MSSPLLIATRGSPLARVQAEAFKQALRPHLGKAPIELLPLTTSGDRFLDTALTELGGKGLFTKELDAALLSGEAQLAVHSCKDLPSHLPDGLTIAAVLCREDARDALIGPVAGPVSSLRDLPLAARLGTASVRRRAQALAIRPDLQSVLIRGNVATRLQKLDAGEADAILLAAAGLKRLGLGERVSALLPLPEFLPAPGQGLIVAVRREDAPTELCQACAAVEHRASRLALEAERAFQARLDGSCRTPMAAHCAVAGRVVHMLGEVLTIDGGQRWRAEETLSDGVDDKAARALGLRLAERVLADGAGQALGV